MKRWTSRDARAKFCELIRKAGSEGAQVVTRRGADAVVVVSVEEWKCLKSAQKPDIKKLLIDDGPKFEDFPLPDRKKWRLRKPVKLT